jgi:UDP-N-acetylglucosamine 3-dehydrogenase
VHLPIFAEREGLALVTIAGSDHHKAETLSRRFSVPLVIDAVVLCTPNSIHEDMALAGLERGRHALVERPLAATSEEGARLAEAAVQTGSVLSAELPG